MDYNGANNSYNRPLDESLIRELPQLQNLRIAPLRHPVSSRGLSVPSPLEPNASGVRESKASSAAVSSGSAGSHTNLPTVTELSNTTQTKKNDDSMLNLEPPPKPILPAFVNLRALERFPYSSFDEDSHLARKRRRLDVHPDAFGEHLQLPIPQQQKEQRPPPFGPFAILNGLNEPPPNAALLPPIEAGSITHLLSKPTKDDAVVEPALLTNNNTTESHASERREGRIEEILASPVDNRAGHADQNTVEDSYRNKVRANKSSGEHTKDTRPDKGAPPPAEKSPQPPSPKTRGRSRKNLRKWTEEETRDLLRGVIKCGIGNWTAILAQPELKFNKRSASNLKDRFRVCCPWAYRAADPNEATRQVRDKLAEAIQRTEAEGDAAAKVHLPHPQSSNSGSDRNWSEVRPVLQTNDSSSSGCSLATIRTDTSTSESGIGYSSSRTISNESVSTLASLVVTEPPHTVKPRRRARRPFTSAEDEALVKGYAVHGFQWTLIQQDKRLNLCHRRATDLRDRFRTKFPHAYREGGSISGNSLQPETQNPNPTDEPSQATGTKRSRKAERRSASVHHGKADSVHRTDSAMPGPSGSAFPRHVPAPQGLSENSMTGASSAGPSFPFHLDGHSATTSNTEAPWTDNTLAPMVWDDIP
ncbi:telomere repeat binding factor family protein [Aspergillus glaucus CBS 516.65]|uniref:Myb-like domain-containing protein n=1 Tax=Aspergillus glaucus CBS 516.65 TaxID=1160497 RepID=A0A1L9VK15_ASPGL|nr:hypothetical protein ASPGLDRAFT_126473 [Aspergillus glaucus CBS 516.65]OJJ84268.1 hypothetical protein ASPGLDRAFT_126473 [Aspergillus glaucus CBS 516.65]